ncbi:MAG: hypothetical protein GC202_02070 [Alphaproteobacteria bacterium]|nr:hypothetical protein [Alphaproteobacteria bacterium]
MIRPSLVIPRIRATVAVFGNRVAGAAELQRLAKDGRLARPCAFVVPGGEDASATLTVGDVTQQIRPRFGVVVCIDNTSDERGAAGAEQLVDLREALVASLVGWSPDDARYEGLVYRGMPDDPVADADRAQIWAQFDFESEETIQG